MEEKEILEVEVSESSDYEASEECGIIAENEEQVEVVVRKTFFATNMLRKITLTVSLVCCLLVVITGVFAVGGAFGNNYFSAPMTNSEMSTTYTYHKFYGGDAYTGIQQAAADAANNAGIVAENTEATNELLDNMYHSMYYGQQANIRIQGIMMIVVGVLCGAYFSNKFAELITEEKIHEEKETVL